jgi:predicted AlkP superfamily pyrophosphatase or phosphodiesterase
VTMNAKITWNLPEVFIRRNGGSMDLESVEKYGTPGLVAEISKAYPSFPQQWVDDRTRTLATLYLLKTKHPDLVLTHLVDLDSDAHDRGPYTSDADATLERTDALIGDILKALPKGYDFVLVSDHGFELLDHVANLKAEAAQAGITGDLKAMGGLVTTTDPKVADWLRAEAKKPGSDVGREVPHDELIQYAPDLGDAVAAFEPAAHVMFFGRDTSGPVHVAPPEKGEHGFWPMREDYRSIFMLSGSGIKPAALGQVQMLSLKDRLAGAMGLACPAN